MHHAHPQETALGEFPSSRSVTREHGGGGGAGGEQRDGASSRWRRRSELVVAKICVATTETGTGVAALVKDVGNTVEDAAQLTQPLIARTAGAVAAELVDGAVGGSSFLK